MRRGEGVASEHESRVRCIASVGPVRCWMVLSQALSPWWAGAYAPRPFNICESKAFGNRWYLRRGSVQVNEGVYMYSEATFTKQLTRALQPGGFSPRLSDGRRW